MIAETIQVSLTPVFVLVAIASILNFLTTRLGRVVDRSRLLQQQHGETEGMEHDELVCEMRSLARRIELVNRAMLMLVLSGLTIGSTVIILFFGGLTDSNVEHVAAGAFILSITLMLVGLIMFLLETREASASLRIPETYLELDRKI
ncbi:DUF2721 domain-containing protein [Pontixanthobacter aestiaquae]|uniref:DUF2721 domain-containing protein n=1 Tax=Pontixanthobacter aestiaquae TaxID=1509367 RepID=A0A844Z778_9SPHN|nr:DUF2721 domain-containing protein [Pontixanthobacter aestiaquae]MDN3646276.1 DUF2721 domain-containing protein [Pontixanthobacter aestiaquae]MXO82733.1 DUF2721 domain-containing protein [Pontixanthobacter aestiaquae]